MKWCSPHIWLISCILFSPQVERVIIVSIEASTNWEQKSIAISTLSRIGAHLSVGLSGRKLPAPACVSLLRSGHTRLRERWWSDRQCFQNRSERLASRLGCFRVSLWLVTQHPQRDCISPHPLPGLQHNIYTSGAIL